MNEEERAARRAHEAAELAQGPPQVAGDDAAAGLLYSDDVSQHTEPPQELFHAVTPNLDTLLQLLLAIRLHNKDQVSSHLHKLLSLFCHETKRKICSLILLLTLLVLCLFSCVASRSRARA